MKENVKKSKDPNNRPPLTNRPPYQILLHTKSYFTANVRCSTYQHQFTLA